MVDRTDNSVSSFMKRQMKNQYLEILAAMGLNPDLLAEPQRTPFRKSHVP